MPCGMKRKKRSIEEGKLRKKSSSGKKKGVRRCGEAVIMKGTKGGDEDDD